VNYVQQIPSSIHSDDGISRFVQLRILIIS
jgi:hypothetical protein